MNRTLTREEEQERVREATARGYKKILDELNNELVSNGKQSTIFGKMRRHTRNTNQWMIAGALTRHTREAFLWAGLLTQNLSKGWENLTETVSLLAHHWPSVQEQIARPEYISVADTMQTDLTVAFAPVAVSEKVADVLNQQIALIKDAQTTVNARHAEQRFLGPFIEEKAAYDLKNIFKIRHDPDSQFYGHCVIQVARLEEEMDEIDAPKTAMARVFGVIAAPITARGYDTKAAEAGAEISESNLANIEAAQQARPIPPPQFNIV